MMFEDLAQPFLLSILIGSLYTLMALGLTMSFTVTKFANISHSEVVTTGAYTAVVIINIFGAGLIQALVISFIVCAILAVALDETVYKPLFKKGGKPLHLLVASIGAGLVVRYTLSIFLDWQDLLIAKSLIVVEPLMVIGHGTVTTLHILVFPTTLGIVFVLHFLLTKTKLGTAMRATASNFELAKVCGINTDLTRRITWVIAGGLAGIGGAFWSIYAPINPEIGWWCLLSLFAAFILGGLVSFYGTIAGAYIIGFAENFGITFMHRSFGIDVAYKPLITLGVIVAVLLIRPAGLAGIRLPSIKTFIKKQRGDNSG